MRLGLLKLMRNTRQSELKCRWLRMSCFTRRVAVAVRAIHGTPGKLSRRTCSFYGEAEV